MRPSLRRPRRALAAVARRLRYCYHAHVLDRLLAFRDWLAETENRARRKFRPVLSVEPLEIRWLPTVSAAGFSASSYTVAENAGKVTLTVNLDTSPTATITADYATSAGTATSGTDFTAASGTLTFAPGVTSRTLDVWVTDDDNSSEGEETLTVTLSNVVGGSLGSPSSATVRISDQTGLPPGWQIKENPEEADLEALQLGCGTPDGLAPILGLLNTIATLDPAPGDPPCAGGEGGA